MDVRSTIDLMSPVSAGLIAGLVLAVVVVSLLARRLAGPPTGIARRWGLFAVRTLIVVALLAVLANPVRVDESPGDIERSKVFYLVDTSESMALGDGASRLDEATRVIREAQRLVPPAKRPQLSAFRFGRRLSAIESDPWLDSNAALAPNEPDTQLLSALRELTGRFGRAPPASAVLFSDGRARDPDGVEDIARRYAGMQVPLHVVPVGDRGRAGDVAVINMIVPERVRKYSEVNAQIFLRSYGYDGLRSQLILSALGDDGDVRRQLNHLPITLRNGIQSFQLSFRSEMERLRVRASIAPQPNEVSLENNAVSADVSIDRTKIRVLYVVGSAAGAATPGRQVRGPRYSYSHVVDALSADPDVECNVFVALSRGSRYRPVGGDSTLTLPATPAELFAYDAVVLSNAPRASFTDQQLAWIDRWVNERGGGLSMVGGPQSFASGGWRGTVLEKMLPVAMQPAGDDWTTPGKIVVRPVPSTASHSIWNLVADESQNRTILAAFPACQGANRVPRAKTTATVLAAADSMRTADGPMPVIAAGPYGKGRTLAMTIPIDDRWAADLVRNWGPSDKRYYQKLWRNIIYWLTEDSSIGRRRLIATTDKMLYRPGETILIEAMTYNEGASRTTDYRLEAMIEPQSATVELDSDYCAVCWPNELQRTSGAEGPLVAWGEPFDLPLRADQKGFDVALPISDDPAAGSASQSLRIELSAYEDFALVDSTSLDVQILDDPFEQQNPLPNPELLRQVARLSGGEVLPGAEALAAMLRDLPTEIGPPVVRKAPLWSRWWLLSVLLVLLVIEWAWRRSLGLA